MTSLNFGRITAAAVSLVACLFGLPHMGVAALDLTSPAQFVL